MVLSPLAAVRVQDCVLEHAVEAVQADVGDAVGNVVVVVRAVQDAVAVDQAVPAVAVVHVVVAVGLAAQEAVVLTVQEAVELVVQEDAVVLA